MAKKICEICGKNPATVPDRERMGRPINRVCSSCHSLRLIGDMKRIMELREKNRAQRELERLQYDLEADEQADGLLDHCE
jgi:hypothetical protein